MPIAPPPQMKASMFGRMPVGAPTQKGKPPAPKPPSGLRIEHRIGVAAPAEVIWEVIYDLDGWSRWNPLYPKATGQVRIGETLDITETLPGESPHEFKATVLEWVPNEQLHWKTQAMGGLMRTIRYMEIDAIAETGCIVANGEIFGGLMGQGFGRRVGSKMHRALRQMNEALKAEAELRWAARAGGG